MGTTPIRAWTKTGTASEGISLSAAPLASSTPQPGDVWELTFYAKFVSGSQGGGFTFRFRGYNTAGTSMNRDVSDDAQIDLIEDDQWHRYTAYVTIADDAYAYGDEIYPHFGWRSSTANGTVHMNGVTVRKVGNQWNNMMPYLGFNPSSSTTELVEVSSANSPIAYQKTIRAAHNGTSYQYQISAPLSTFPQPTATDRWTLSFWAKTDGNNTVKLYKRTSNSGAPQSTALIKDDRWHYYVIPLSLGSGFDLSDIALYYAIAPQSELLLNGISLVPGDVPLATESDQNSAALKNITIDTGSTKFNTAIEYDTDHERRAYSRVKHYINNGEAISYSYDDNGNISSIQNPDGSWVEYEYDDLNQLVGEHYSTTQPLASLVEGGGTANAVTEGVSYNAISYEYDSRGNILSKVYSLNGETVDTITYTYGDTVWADRLTSFNGTSISYDEIGNPLNWANGETLSWQHGRQLASYSLGDTEISYTYNQNGIRTSKTVNGVTTSYNVIDGTLRRMTSGENTLEFINGTSVIFNGIEYWYVFNAQNDVIGLIDANGNYVVEYTYDAWGAPLSKTGSLADTLGTLNPFRYRGYIYDEEIGWYYCNRRYYDPVVSRFLNADEVAVATATPETPHWDKNLYAYCDNNPVVRADVDGEFWNFIVGAIGGAIAGGISALISGTDIGAGIVSGAMSGAITGAAIDVAIATGGAGIGVFAAVSAVSGLGASGASYVNQRMNGVAPEDIDYGAVIVDGLWGSVGGALSFGLADVGGKACQTFTEIISQPAKKIVKQTVYDVSTATIVSTGTSLAAVGTNSIGKVSGPTEQDRPRDWYRYRYGGLW